MLSPAMRTVYMYFNKFQSKCESHAEVDHKMCQTGVYIIPTDQGAYYDNTSYQYAYKTCGCENMSVLVVAIVQQ